MIGVIPAAGKASRMGQLGSELPKALIEVEGRTLLERAIESLKTIGVSEVVVVVGHLGERFFGRDAEVIAEVDAGAGFGRGDDVREDAPELFGRHQKRDEAGGARLHRRPGLARGVRWHARARDVVAVAEVQMNVDHTR